MSLFGGLYTSKKYIIPITSFFRDLTVLFYICKRYTYVLKHFDQIQVNNILYFSQIFPKNKKLEASF